jgi:hypothetical protein
MQAQARRPSSSTNATTIDLAASSLLFGTAAEKACGWFDSSLELSQGLQVNELSDRELLALWRALKLPAGVAQH